MVLYVNGQAVDETRIHSEIKRLRPEYERTFANMDSAQREQQLIDWSKENVIEAVLLSQEAARQIGAVAQAAMDAAFDEMVQQHGGKEDFDVFLAEHRLTLGQVQQDLENQLRIRQFIQKIESRATPPTDKQIRKYYQENQQRFMMPMMVRVAHIVRHPHESITPEQAKTQMDKILARLKAGEDFGKLAAEGSDCPEQGGDLGYFAAGQMVQAFEDAVFALEPGQISDVFETEFGFHIAKLIDKRPPTLVSLEHVREMIAEELHTQSRQKAVEQTIDDLRTKATIEER
jgi:parvulin-like peptidyl-prolyl isomerase